MKGWSGNAVRFGVASAVVTLLLNWIGGATSGDPCRRGSPLGFLAFLVFLGLMGGAGFMTARAGGTIGAATMAGLVGALISAVGTIIGVTIIVGSINASQCGIVNNTGVSTQTLLTTGGVIAGIFISFFGLGIGAGAGAIGGLMGRRPAAPTV
jgi:hypothetical protein